MANCSIRRHSIDALNSSRVRAMLEADVDENQIYLDAIARGDLSPRSPTGCAALLLQRVAKEYGLGPGKLTRGG